MIRDHRGTQWVNEVAKVETLASLKLSKSVVFKVLFVPELDLGDDANPSVVKVKALDLDGNKVEKVLALRVRLLTSTVAPIANSTNGVIGVDPDASTVLVSSITADKDIVVETDETGLATLVVTNETPAEGMRVCIGPALVGGIEADYTSSTDAFSHAVSIVSGAKSTITASVPGLVADGESTFSIVVQAKDIHEDVITVGGSTVVVKLTSGSGTIPENGVVATDNGDGTYTAVLTVPSVSGSGTFSATFDGAKALTGNVEVLYTGGAAVVSHCTLSRDLSVIEANGSATATITISIRDAYDNPTVGDVEAVISSGAGTLSAVTSNVIGVYTVDVTSSEVGSGMFAVTVDNKLIGSTGVSFAIGAMSAGRSTLTPSTASIAIGGSETTIAVTPKDASGHTIVSPGVSVAFSLAEGDTGTLGNVVYHSEDGTYTTTLTSPADAGTATVSATIGGAPVGEAPGATCVVTYTEE